MLPILLSERTKVGLAGQGDGLGRRAQLLLEAGIEPVLLPSHDADDAVLARLSLLLVAGLDEGPATDLAVRARALGVLVNVEDRPELCDFHVPAVVRRGPQVLTVSTGGKAPGLARRLREQLDRQFGPEWKARVEDLGKAREGWRANGLAPDDISQRTRAMISERGWL